MKKKIIYTALILGIAFTGCKKDTIEQVVEKKMNQSSKVKDTNEGKNEMVQNKTDKELNDIATFISDNRGSNNASRSATFLTEAEVLVYMEGGLNYDFRVDQEDTYYYLSHETFTVDIPCSGSPKLIEDVDLFDAQDEAIETIQGYVDWDNGVVMRASTVDNIGGTSTIMTVQVTVSIYSQALRPTVIESGENIYAGNQLGGCNSHTPPSYFGDAADRIRTDLNKPWIVTLCYDGSTPTYVSGGGNILTSAPPSGTSCVAGKFYSGNANVFMNATTLQDWSDDGQDAIDCFQTGYINTNLGSDYLFTSTDLHWNGSSTGDHEGRLIYKKSYCATSGKGSGYN
ncbi:MAG: hypothetical protein ACJASM_000914 [Salibacteraceae bacterium]|jgi:hypothetical protein